MATIKTRSDGCFSSASSRVYGISLLWLLPLIIAMEILSLACRCRLGCACNVPGTSPPRRSANESSVRSDPVRRASSEIRKPRVQRLATLATNLERLVQSSRAIPSCPSAICYSRTLRLRRSHLA